MIRSLAATLVFVLLAQELAMAAGTDLWNHTTIPTPSFLNPAGGAGSAAGSPGSRTTLKRRYKGSDLIINVQDSHESLSAQESISKLLDDLTSSYNLDLVGIEGMEGRVDTSLVADFPDERVRDNIARELLGKTMISAAEYRQIIRGGQVELYGVENAALYRRNVRDYQRLLTARPKALGEMGHLKKQIDRWSLGRVPELVPVIHKLCTDHAAGRIKFADYWNQMSVAAARAGVDPAEFPALTLLIQALELEKSIDFNRAAAEREALITALKAHLSQSDRALMLKWLVLFKMGKMGGPQIHRMLLERAVAVLPGKKYPELTTYSKYLAMYEKIDLGEFFLEIRSFERRLTERLLPDADSKQAFYFIEMTGLLERLLKGEMTPFDHRRYIELRAAAGLGEMRRTFGAERVPAAEVVDWDILERADLIARGFYIRAQERNRAMIDRLTARMREKGVHTAALVTGGFHAEGLSELMENDQISHMVVLPEFDPNGPKRAYATVITLKGAYLNAAAREAALAEVIALAVWSASVQGVSVPRAQAILERNAAKLGLKNRLDPGAGHSAKRSGVTTAGLESGLGSAQISGHAADGWLGTSSVLGNLDAERAGQLIRDLEVSGERIRVGPYLFRGSTRTETTSSGVVRRHGMVEWIGTAAPGGLKMDDVSASRIAVKQASSEVKTPQSGSEGQRMDEYLEAIRSTENELVINPGPVRTTERLSNGFDQLLEMRLRRQGLDPVVTRSHLKNVATQARDRAVSTVQAAARMAELPATAAISPAARIKTEPILPTLKLSSITLKIKSSGSRMASAAPNRKASMGSRTRWALLGLVTSVLLVFGAEYALDRFYGMNRRVPVIAELNLPAAPDVDPSWLMDPSKSVDKKPAQPVLKMEDWLEDLGGSFPVLRRSLDDAQARRDRNALRRSELATRKAQLDSQTADIQVAMEQAKIDLQKSEQDDPKILQSRIDDQKLIVAGLEALAADLKRVGDLEKGILKRQLGAPAGETADLDVSTAQLRVDIVGLQAEIKRRSNEIAMGGTRPKSDVSLRLSAPPTLDINLTRLWDRMVGRIKKIDDPSVTALREAQNKLDASQNALRQFSGLRGQLNDRARAALEMAAAQRASELSRQVVELNSQALVARTQLSQYQADLARTSMGTALARKSLSAGDDRLAAVREEIKKLQSELTLTADDDTRSINRLGIAVIDEAVASKDLILLEKLLARLADDRRAETTLLADAIYRGMAKELADKSPDQAPALYRQASRLLDAWARSIGTLSSTRRSAALTLINSLSEATLANPALFHPLTFLALREAEGAVGPISAEERAAYPQIGKALYMRSNFPTLAFSKETTAFIRTDGAAAAHHVIWEHAHQLADQMSVVLARSAGKDLSALFKRPTLTALTEAALEPDADRRMETAFYAAAHPDFVPYLMLLKNDPDPGVRSAVLIGLSGFEAVTALPQGWIDPRAEAIVTASGSEAALLAERLPRSEAVRSIRATLSSTAASDDKIFQSIVAARRLGYPELFPDLLNWLERDGQSRKFIFHHTPYLWSEVWANSGIVDVYPATVKLARQTLDELARSARRETRAAEVVIAAQASIRRAEQQKRWGFIIHVAAPLLLEADPAAYRRYVETRQYRTAVWMERSNYYAPLAIGFVSLILLFGLFKTFFINRHYPKKMLAGWRPPVSLPKRGKSSGGRPGPSAARMATQHLNIESEVENGGNRKDPVELLGRRIGEWESMTDTGRGMAAEDISLHILLIAQQIATSLPGKFNEEPLRLIWNGDDRQRALTHEQYYDALELMRDVLNRVLPKEYHLAESLPPAERLERLAVLDTAALHLARLVPALHAYVTIEDFKYFVRQFYEYRMPWFLEWLYAYGYLMKSTRKALIRVVGDYYRSVAVDPLLAESHVDVYLQKQDTEQRFMAASDRARAKTGKTRWGLGRRFRRLIAIVFPLGTSAVALAMSGWQLSLILGPAFALIGVAWHWYTAFGATEQLQNYIERKAFFDQTLSRYREMTGWNGSAETSGPASIPSVQQAAAALRDEALTAGEEALDLVLVMAGGDQSAHQERVRSTLEEQPVIQKTRARVILMPDHQTGSGSFLTMLAAHRKLKQGITLEALWSALAADPQIRQLNLRMDWDRTLPVSRRQKSLTPGQEGLRIAILYAGGPDDQRTRSRQQLEAAAERILSTAAIAWNDRKSLVMNLSADIRYEGPGPIFGWEGNFGRPGEIFLPSVLASPGQINEENLDVVLPSYDGKVYQVFVPRGHVEEIKDELAEKDTRHASPVRVMNSEHPNFRQLPVATKLWTFAPSDSILNLIHAMDAAMSREELKPAFAALNQRMGHGSVARLFLSIVAQWQSGDTNLADAIRDTLQAADPSGLNMELIRSFESLKTVFGRLLREYDKTSIPTIRTVISPDPASVSRPAVDADFLPVSRVVSAVSENPAVVAPPVRMIHETPRYRLTVLLNSFILLKEDSAGGREVILSPANGRFQGRTADGAEWIGMFRDAEKKHFVIAEDGAEVPLAEISDKTFSRLTALLVSGARLAQPSRSNNIWASINRGFWNSAAAPDPKFKPRYLIGQEPSGAANKENEKQALIALLRFMTSEGDVSGSAVDAWIDLVIRMGLPKVEPFRLERGSDGYSWGSPAARGTSPEISKAMGSLKLALTASDRGSARDRAFEAARTLLDFIAGSADISAARIHLKKAFSGFGRSYRVAIQRRLALPPNGAVNAGVLPQRILIKEDLFLENLNFFKSENDLLTNRLKKFGQTLPVVIIAGLTDELRKLAPAERKAAYRRSHDFGGDFDILFLDLDSEEDRALLESGRSDRQALLTRASSTAARYLFSVKTSVIVAEPVEGAAYTGILFASARHLIEGRQSLPGMKKITDGYYRYLPPLRPGELLRLITDAAQSLESTAASA